MQRAKSSRVHNLLLDMLAPQEQVILSVTKNKVPLNAMLAEALLDPDFYAQATSQNSVIIADVTDAPVQIIHDLKINHRNLSSSHEEAVVIIAQLAVAMSLEDKSVCVVCDDTHVFLLLVHFTLSTPQHFTMTLLVNCLSFMDYLVLTPLQHYAPVTLSPFALRSAERE